LALALLVTPMVFFFAPCGGAIRHRETWIYFKRFLVSNWKNLQEFFLWAQVLVVSQSLVILPQHDPLVQKCFFPNLVLRLVRE
jgi:hypothetical protein